MNPVLLAAYAAAVAATGLLLRHVARRYPDAPKRIPARINADGRPSRAQTGRWILWLGPAVLGAVEILIGVLLVAAPPREDQVTELVLVMLAFVEVAWLLAWSTDRQIEMARKMTYRIAPTRLLRAMLPLLLTVAVALAVAIRAA